LRLIAFYCRVSSRKQKTYSEKSELKRWLRANCIKSKDVTWFEDKETGKTLKRPAFDKQQKAVFDGEVKTVIVWKLDRISRRLKNGVVSQKSKDQS
jgi:DNA invertase Pin-like site-specific DNA recombinase